MAGANAVAADENGFVFYGTIRMSQISIPNPCEIFQVIVAGGGIVLETQLTTAAFESRQRSAYSAETATCSQLSAQRRPAAFVLRDDRADWTR